ncbi:MAG: VCBS repeat-containing protein [Spirochaetes bacterium]|nr:VCBS repeat-containing protein [Spirochaetota bacterium]
MKNNIVSRILFIRIVLIILVIFSLSFGELILCFGQNEAKSISIGGKIIEYFKKNIDEDKDEEFIIIYKNLFKKKIYFSIYKYQGNNLFKIFDEEVEDIYYCFSFSKIESSQFFNIVFLSKNSLFYLSKDKKIIKLFDINHIYKFNFDDRFPYLNISYDIDNDEKDEFFIFDESGINIYKDKNLIQKINIDLRAFYDYSLSFGGFNVIHSITILIPDIFFNDFNNDGFGDFVLIFQDKLISYIYYDKGKRFLKNQDLNLKNYVTIRSGYSPINKYIILDDFNGDKTIDVIVMNFSMAAVFNTDKLGTIVYIFYGNNDGNWKEQPDKKIYLNEMSGIESFFLFYDVNKDGVKDLINIGTKLFSSNFILSLTVKRSFLISINIYSVSKEGDINLSPLYSLSRNISLDSETTQDSSQIDFSSYAIINLTDFFNSIFGKFNTDINNDGIIDLLVYNFDGSYSIFYSSLKNPNIFNKKEDNIIFVSNDLKKIYYLAGPYSEFLFAKNKNVLLIINKALGKIYLIEI